MDLFKLKLVASLLISVFMCTGMIRCISFLLIFSCRLGDFISNWKWN